MVLMETIGVHFDRDRAMGTLVAASTSSTLCAPNSLFCTRGRLALLFYSQIQILSSKRGVLSPHSYNAPKQSQCSPAALYWLLVLPRKVHPVEMERQVPFTHRVLLQQLLNDSRFDHLFEVACHLSKPVKMVQ
eukprot:2753049-Amphidinium_carterae.1